MLDEFNKDFFDWLFDEITNSSTLILTKETAYYCKTPEKWNSNYAKLERLYGHLLSISHLDMISNNFIIFKADKYFYEIAYIHEDYSSSIAVRYLSEKPEEYIDLNEKKINKKKSYRALYILVNPDYITKENEMRSISNLITKATLEYVSKNPNNSEVKNWMNTECKVVLLESNQRIMDSWHMFHGGYFMRDKNRVYKYITIGIVEKDNAVPLLRHFKQMF